MKELSREVEWFVEMMREQFELVVSVEEVAVEAVELGMDEVENFYVPTEVFVELPSSLLYEIMVWDDVKGNEYVGVIAFLPNSPNWCLQAMTENGQLVYRETSASL